MKKFLLLTILLVRVATQMTYAQDITATVTHETGVSANKGTIVLEGLLGFADNKVERCQPKTLIFLAKSGLIRAFQIQKFTFLLLAKPARMVRLDAQRRASGAWKFESCRPDIRIKAL